MILLAMTTLVSDGIQDSRYNWVWDVPYGREWQFSKLKMSEEDYQKAREMMKIAVAVQYFLPGNPCIYYGDEVGMYGFRDPFNRQCFPWNNIDKELYEFFVKIGKARGKIKFLSNAKTRIIEANDKILVFERYLDNDENDSYFRKSESKVFVAINRSENEISIDKFKNLLDAKTIFEYNVSDDILSKYGILIKTAK